MAVCARCGRENPEDAKFCNECAAPLVETPAREQRKTVTVLFCDVTGSTQLGENLDPEALRALLARYFERMRRIVEHHGGTVEKFIGDAVMAVFGLPVVHEDDALRAVRAAVEMREAFPELGLDGRIGLTTGEVVTGTEERLATGDPVNVAARLEQAAQPGEIVISEQTLRLIRHAVEVEDVQPLKLKGKAEAVQAFRLLAVRPDEDFRRRLDAPMVGRQTELRRLHDAFEQAESDPSCQLFTVLGLAGVGKSRLVQEFLGELAGRALLARGRCLAYGEGITFWPLLEVVKEAVGIEDSDSPDVARTKLIGALGEAQDAGLVAHRVGEMIGLAETAAGAEEGFAAARFLFEALARVQPLVLVFDDIHWGEATFLDFIEHIADWTRDAPILLVCLARPELLDTRPAWGGGKLNATSALLEPLSVGESSELVRNLAGGSVLEEDARSRIVDAAEGNPLFVEQMLALVLEDGKARKEIQIPASIQALLAARIDSLAENERALLELASMGGKVFYEDAVTELAGEGVRKTAAESLASLLRKELIRPDRPALGSRTYRFRHLLIRDAAYDSIPKKARADVHERFGRWLERSAGDRATEYEEVVGYHFEQAYRYRAELGPVDDASRAVAREAAERLGAAGQRAFVRSDAPAGVNLISRAVALLQPEDPLRVELVPNVRVVQGMGGDMTWAERVLTEAVEVAATTGDRQLAATALVQRGFLRLFTASGVTSPELFDVADRAIPVFEELGDELGLARTWRLVGQAHYLDRHLAACAEASERALEHVRRAGDRFEEREIVEWLVIALFLGPEPAPEAARRCRRLLEAHAGDVAKRVLILGGLAFLVAMQGRLEEANELIARGRRGMDELGEWVWLFAFHSATISLWQGNPAAAELELRPSYDALKKLGEKSHFSTIAQALGQATYMLGRYREAEQFTLECEEACRPNDVQSSILWRSTRAKVLAQKEAFEAAEQIGQEAVSLAEESDFLLAQGDAHMDLGEVLRLAGRPEAAAAQAHEAIRLYELKGNALAAGQARAQLEQLV